MLTPQQLEIISNEYYIKGFVHGRNRLYTHLKSSYQNVFDSRDAIGEWLKYQEVNQFFQYQKKPKVVSSMIPRRPFHSLSLEYRFILVIIDNFSRYIFCYPLISKSPSATRIAL